MLGDIFNTDGNVVGQEDYGLTASFSFKPTVTDDITKDKLMDM